MYSAHYAFDCLLVRSQGFVYLNAILENEKLSIRVFELEENGLTRISWPFSLAVVRTHDDCV